jgi:hypothetical protein
MCLQGLVSAKALNKFGGIKSGYRKCWSQKYLVPAKACFKTFLDEAMRPSVDTVGSNKSAKRTADLLLRCVHAKSGYFPSRSRGETRLEHRDAVNQINKKNPASFETGLFDFFYK